MLHLLTEENSDLKYRKFPLAKGIRKHLQGVLDNYQGDTTVDGYQRLNNILAMDGIAYSEMKRIKNFFDHYEGPKDNPEYVLNGGDEMKLWVDNTLNTARQAVYNFKQAKKEAGIDNAFRKPHTKDRSKPKLGFQESKQARTFIISEGQLKLIKEAMDNTFSLDELSSLRHFSEKVRYCTQHLGPSVGRGTSRVVFQMDDDTVLKLAYNQKGVGQNNEEINFYESTFYTFFPEIYDSAKDKSWIVVEAVLPAKKQDFNEVFGISWKSFSSFIYSIWGSKQRFSWLPMSKYQIEKLIDENVFLCEIAEYIMEDYNRYAEMMRINNWGLTNRNGRPEIVLLDNGLTEDVYNRYYA